MSESAVAPPRHRIAFLTTSYPKVSHTFIRREILALEALGWQVLRLAIRDAGEAHPDPLDVAEARRTRHCLEEPAPRLVAQAIGVVSTRPRRALRALRSTLQMAGASERGWFRHLAYLVEACWLLRTCERERISHVHVHFGTNAAAVARLSAQLGGPSYSMTVHGPDEFDAPLGLSLAAKIRDAAFVVGISHFCTAQLRRWADPPDWPRVHIVRCSVDSECHSPEPVDPSSRMLLTVGRLSAQKGHRVLLEAMARLVADGRDPQLVLAGDGELRPDVEKTIGELGLEDRVRITGWIAGDEVRKLLRECRALVLPSFAEGLPVVLMEAFAAGRTAISTWVAGIPELVRPGENGWLVPAGDVDALAAAMAEVLDAPASLLDERGHAGRQEVLRNHSDAGEARKLSQLLSDALRSRSSGSG